MSYRAHVSDLPADPSNIWADFVKRARKAKGWSIDEMAARAGVSRMTVMRWEQGRTGFRAETVDRVATALGVSREAAFAAAFGEGEVPLPPPIPLPIAYLLDVHERLPEADRKVLLERVEMVAQWADAYLAERRGLPQPPDRATRQNPR
jgi:putative transcriptional regulator